MTIKFVESKKEKIGSLKTGQAFKNDNSVYFIVTEVRNETSTSCLAISVDAGFLVKLNNNMTVTPVTLEIKETI
jgi:hypothetical protein